METPPRASRYDLFKLIVAVFLLILALILMWISPPQTSTPVRITPTVTIVSPTASLLTATASAIVSPTGAIVLEVTATPFPSSTSPPLAEVASPTATEISEPTWTPFPPSTETSAFQPTATPPPPPDTQAPEPSPTPIAPPTATPPPPEPTATPIAGLPPTDVCQAATSRSRLQVGNEATILRRLNFRSSPGIRDNWLLTNIPGTQVRIIGGPECVPYWNGAYLWWQIQLPDGSLGWSAEGSLNGSFYFMEPK